MKKQYKIQLPKGKKVTMTNVDFEDGVMTVNVEIENRENFHEAIHNEVCGVFGKINNQWKEVLKANGITREKIEEMAKESIKELEKDCPDIWDKMIQEYGKAICGKKEQKHEPKDGDFVYVKAEYEHIAIFKNIKRNDFNVYAECNEITTNYNCKNPTIPICHIKDVREVRLATEEEKKLLIEKLAEVGKRWNEEKKCLEDVRWRAAPGKSFYTIYPLGDVNLITRPSNPNIIDDDYQFWQIGNYFKTREAAEKVAEQIREIFKESSAY